MVKVFLIVIVLVGAMLYQMEADPRNWASHSMLRLDASPMDIIKFVTNVDQIEKWFNLVSYVRQADFRAVGVNKQYHVIYNLPWLGEYTVLCKVIHYDANRKLHLECEGPLKPHVEFNIHQGKSKETYLTIKVWYRRTSILFQYTLAPLLNFITSQRLHQSLFTLRMLFPY